ncbi:unnamed protein product [Aureobasidium vineae]|uniref:Nucleolar protein 12 n=1 Tax=Aureobasidium vineae TaxID=2773715 RepID=A0A9N8K0X1_9PEZI|nr:unnamed protein product [Aureobasidium vineae]
MAHSKDKKDKSQKKDKVEKKEQKPEKTQKASALAAAEKLDPTISSLFANSFGAAKPIYTDIPTQSARATKKGESEDEDEGDDNDEELSELDDDELDAVDADDDNDEEAEVEDDSDVEVPDVKEAEAAAQAALESNNRKRKRKDKQPELEDVYMDKLGREEERAIAKAKEDRNSKRQKTEKKAKKDSDDSDSDSEDEDSDAAEGADAMEMSPPPLHETLEPDNDSDLVKAQRTVFLGNVSAEAITSKTAKKTLMRHLESFFEDIADPEKGQPAHSVESLRFRSTAYASAIPKKAAFAKKEIMVETTKSTNAYAVYSSNALAREAARRLNGTVVLDRHLRVDEVAHPAKTEPRRCVFVGNLGFVDDESNIDKANAEEGKGTRKGNKTPATSRKVESVRVPRDPQTRVGKGFAYVQFTEENAVEAALLLNEKKFPPMLPRKLRVTRAKTIKRNVKPGSNAVKAPGATNKGIYNPKADPVMQSNMGRAGKLLGRAAAAQVQKGKPIGATPQGFKTPESFIFEGHRAKAGSGKSGLKLGGSGKKKGKPRTRSSNRAAAWKAGGGKKRE